MVWPSWPVLASYTPSIGSSSSLSTECGRGINLKRFKMIILIFAAGGRWLASSCQWPRGERYPRFLIEWIYCWIESCQFQHFESNFELNFFELNNVLNWILSKIFLLNILLNWILSQNFLLNFLLNWIGLKNWKSIVFWIDIVILYPKIP